MYQLGSLFIFDKKLMSVYVGGCNKNVLLSISKNTDGCWEMLFPFSKVFTSTKSYWFWYKGFINNSLGVTWKFCPRNFKKSEIDCTISQKKNNSELQKFKKSNIPDIWLCKKLMTQKTETLKNEWKKRKHFLRTLFNVAGVVNMKLVFTDWLFYY